MRLRDLVARTIDGLICEGNITPAIYLARYPYRLLKLQLASDCHLLIAFAFGIEDEKGDAVSQDLIGKFSHGVSGTIIHYFGQAESEAASD